MKSCFWSDPKQIGPVPTNLDVSKTIWSNIVAFSENLNFCVCSFSVQGNTESPKASNNVNFLLSLFARFFAWRHCNLHFPGEQHMYGFCAQVQQLTSLVGTYFLRLLTYALSFYRSKSFWVLLGFRLKT